MTANALFLPVEGEPTVMHCDGWTNSAVADVLHASAVVTENLRWMVGRRRFYVAVASLGATAPNPSASALCGRTTALRGDLLVLAMRSHGWFADSLTPGDLLALSTRLLVHEVIAALGQAADGPHQLGAGAGLDESHPTPKKGQDSWTP